MQSQFLQSENAVFGKKQVLVSCVVDHNTGEHSGRTPEECKEREMIISRKEVRLTNFDDVGGPLILGKNPTFTIDKNHVCTITYENGTTSTFKFARLPIESEIRDTWLFHKTIGEGIEYYVYMEKSPLDYLTQPPPAVVQANTGLSIFTESMINAVRNGSLYGEVLDHATATQEAVDDLIGLKAADVIDSLGTPTETKEWGDLADPLLVYQIDKSSHLTIYVANERIVNALMIVSSN